MAENESPERFAQVLGEAALDLWSELPQEWQQQLFERDGVRKVENADTRAFEFREMRTNR